MTKNFSNVMDYKVVANNVVKMFNNVDDVVDYVVMMMKKYPNNAIYVNDMGIRLERDADGKIGVVLRDSEFNLIRGYVMGKIKRGMDKAVAYVMESVNNMEENNMEENNVEMFNDYVKVVLLNEYNDAVSSAEDFADAYGDDCVENEYICGGMEYDFDIRKVWADWCWENDVMSRNDAYKYYDENSDMFICEDDLDDIVEGLDGTDDVGDGSCLVWVKNPYYVEQEQVENDSPCLDDVDRVVKVIKDYVDNYEGMLMDYNGFTASICVPWDVFNEDDMKMLIEDDGFEVYVSQYLMMTDIYDMLVYDDGVYVSVDADMFEKVA